MIANSTPRSNSETAPAFHVVGAGGIGCAVGYSLVAAGADVTFVDVSEEKVRWGRDHGVSIERKKTLRTRFLQSSDWQPSTGSIILLCTKCYDNRAVLDRLPGASQLIPIQNGFDVALETFGVEAEGISSFVSECHPLRPHTRITRPGSLHLGLRSEGSGAARESLRTLAANLHAAPFSVVETDRILPYKYAKLMYNAAISPLAAAAGIDNGKLLGIATARELFFELLRENYRILRSANVPLARIGPFHPDIVYRILNRPWFARALAWAFYPGLRGTYCSMAGDIEKGRTEIDNYNLHLIQLARDVRCPLNRAVHALVQRMTQERIPPALERLLELKRGLAEPAFDQPGREARSSVATPGPV